VRLTERCLHSDPVRPEEVHEMIEAIDRELSLVGERGIRANSAVTLVGIAGTFTTLAAMEKKLERYSHNQVHGSALTLDEVRRQILSLQEKTIAERKRIVGLEPKRADVIFAGASLLERIMTCWHAETVIVSDQGVRYGLLHEAARPL
jgi:exopolyphosphatase/guanosine-5'-triphosphate,3'-diphosphate pyrophosphatase